MPCQGEGQKNFSSLCSNQRQRKCHEGASCGFPRLCRSRGETCLHLAVKNHQFEAFRLLLENLKEFSKYGVLNGKDIQGNTVLHLAVSTRLLIYWSMRILHN